MFRWGNGGRWSMGLGPYPEVSLAEAREKAQAARKLIAIGVDPRAAREQDRLAAESRAATRTFDVHAKDYIDSKKSGWKNPKHVQQWENTLETYAFPVIGKKTIDEISIDDITSILRPIWHEKAETAQRLRGRIENILSAIRVKEKKEGLNNVAAWKGCLEHFLAEPKRASRIKHHSSIHYDEIPEFIRMLVTYGDTGARAMLLTILTAVRTGEIIPAKWDEFDLVKREWLIPASRMKRKKEHLVPLSEQVCTLLQQLKATARSEWLLPSPFRKKLTYPIWRCSTSSKSHLGARMRLCTDFALAFGIGQEKSPLMSERSLSMRLRIVWRMRQRRRISGVIIKGREQS